MMNDFRADLHCHTLCSDGSLSPEEIIHLAARIGLRGLSITDHDTIDAYAGISSVAAELGIELIPGVEFSASHKNISVHILAYGFCLGVQNEIYELCQRHKSRRAERNNGILKLLAKQGMAIYEEDILLAKGSIGRPHIAQAMVNKGYVASINEAFKLYLAEDKPCYVSGAVFSVEDTLKAIHHSGGLAVIAHPHLLNNERLLADLLDMDFDGLECYYAKFPSYAHQRFLKKAKRKGLLVTGGSDFHGSMKPNIPLGSSWIDQTNFNLLKERLQPLSQ